MKHLILISYTLLFCLTLSCSSEPQTPPETASTEPSSTTDPQAEAAPEAKSPTADVAVCLWNEAGLRDKPGRGKDIKYLATIKFGEVVTLTGNTESMEKEDRTYLEIELSDGKKGWSNGYLFATEAERAAAMKTIEVYKRPELTTITGNKFEQGDIFAVRESDKVGWVEVFGKEKKKSGWARVVEGSYSVDEVDVTVAILLSRATSESDPKKREETLNMIASNGTFATSPLMSVVDKQLAEIQSMPELPANQLYITAENLNVRSEPDNEADNVVFQLGNGTICNILERGERVAIREMNDYWYKIETDGQEGWVYGFFTSKRQE